MSHSSQVLKIDATGHIVDGGQNAQLEFNRKTTQQANRVLSHAVTGTLSDGGGVAQIKEFQAVPAFADVDVATGTLGPTKATLDASLALVNDALDRLFFDANAVAAVLGISGVTFAGGGTKASPIAAITGAGALLTIGPDAATMNPIRDQINTNMHTAAALANKIFRAVGHDPVQIETTPDRQPPPDRYGAGAPSDPGGSGLAFGAESPFTDPTPAITEDSGTHVGTAVTKAVLDTALDTWRNNVETLATRLAVVTNSVVALTDSSTGTAGASVDQLAAFPANSADSGTSLAQKAATDAEMVDIRTSIVSLFTKANALAEGLGVPVRAYDGGGTASDTLPAIGAVAAAATGVQQTEMEAFRAEVDKAFDALAEHVNDIAVVADVSQITRTVVVASAPFDNPVNPETQTFFTNDLAPVPGATIPVTGGTAADPGQQKADVDARFTTAKDNIATLGAKVNEIRSALAAPLVKLV